MDQKNDGRQPFEKLKLYVFNPLNGNPTKWSNTLKQFLANLPTNCLSMFDHFVALALKGLNRPNQFKFIKGCLLQTLFSPFLNTSFRM